MYLKHYQDSITKLYQNKVRIDPDQIDYLLNKNYRSLLVLVPNLSYLSHYHLAKSNNSQTPDLHLWIEQKSRYTSIITLSHQFFAQDKIIKRPDIQIKVYFDVQLVEATSACDEQMINTQHPYLNHCDDRSLKWELNTLLEKWLDYCQSQQYQWLVDDER